MMEQRQVLVVVVAWCLGSRLAICPARMGWCHFFAAPRLEFGLVEQQEEGWRRKATFVVALVVGSVEEGR